MRTLAFLIAMSSVAVAADVPQSVITACQTDALKYCFSEALSGNSKRTGACMRRNGDKLSDECKAAVKAWEKK